MSTSTLVQQEALARAVNGQSLTNYVPIIEAFKARGIPESEILPRENVFTYTAWQALGRQVRKGEHGVKILTWLHKSKINKATGEEESYTMPWSVTVFHVSQTDKVKP
jgi:antirestriction protein ArdC